MMGPAKRGATKLDRRVSRRLLLGRGLRAIALGGSLGLLAAACGGQTPARRGPAATLTAEPSGSATSTDSPPKRGGTLRAVVPNDFVSMWTALANGPTASRCFDWLVRWRKGADGRWGPRPGPRTATLRSVLTSC